MKNRMLAVMLLICAMLLPILASCGNVPDTPEVPDTTVTVTTETIEETTEASPFVKDTLPENLDLNKEKITLSISEADAEDFYSDGETGELVNDSIFKANARVEARLNVELEYLPVNASWANREKYIASISSIISTDGDDFDVLTTGSYVSTFFINGYLKNLNNLPYLNFDMPWWPENARESLEINGILPFMTGDISIASVKGMMCMFFNKDLCTSLGIEDLYETAFNGGWTLEKLETVIKTSYSDANGDNKVDEGDRFGLVLEGGNYTYGFYNSLDVHAFEIANGTYSYVFGNEHNVNAITRISEILNSNEGAIRRGSDENVYYRADNALFKQGNTVITGGWIKCAESYTDLSFEYGIIPYPKYDENQQTYRTTSLPIYKNIAIPVNCKHVDASCAVVEALASEYYRSVIPTYFEVTLKSRYASDLETAKMFDIILNNRCYTFEEMFARVLNDIDITFKNAINNNTKWASASTAIKNNLTKKCLPEIKKAYENKEG